jgi:hypothetical protein
MQEDKEDVLFANINIPITDINDSVYGITQTKNLIPNVAGTVR